MTTGKVLALVGATAALGLSGLGPGSAGRAAAADWTIGGFFSQRFSATDNFDLDPDGGDGITFGSVTDLGVAFTRRTANSRFVLAPGLRAIGYAGGDANGDDNAVRPRFNGSYLWTGLRDDVSASLSIVPESVTDTGFEEGRRFEEDAVAIRLSGALGYGRRIDPRNRVGIDLFARAEEYLEDTEDRGANRSFGGGLSWSRALDPTSTATLSTGLTRFTSEEEDGEDGTSWNVRLGYDRAVSERLSWNASGGVSLVRSDGDVEPGFVGSLGARYRTSDTALSFALAQDVDQDSDGRIESRLSLRLGAEHQVNSRESLGLSILVGGQNPLFGETDNDRRIASITPSYTRRITEDWSLSLGYALRMEDEDDFAWSNTAFVTVSRGLSLLP